MPSGMYIEHPTGTISLSAGKRGPMHPGRTGGRPVTMENYIPSHKKVFQRKTSGCSDGTLKNQPNKMRTTPQHIHTIPIHLVPFCQVCFVFVSCVHRRVVCIGELWWGGGGGGGKWWVCSAR